MSTEGRHEYPKIQVRQLQELDLNVKIEGYGR
jgi:hypothetical protein